MVGLAVERRSGSCLPLLAPVFFRLSVFRSARAPGSCIIVAEVSPKAYCGRRAEVCCFVLAGAVRPLSLINFARRWVRWILFRAPFWALFFPVPVWGAGRLSLPPSRLLVQVLPPSLLRKFACLVLRLSSSVSCLCLCLYVCMVCVLYMRALGQDPLAARNGAWLSEQLPVQPARPVLH